MAILESHLMINLDEDTVTLTELGRDYLKYVANLGLSEPNTGRAIGNTLARL